MKTLILLFALAGFCVSSYGAGEPLRRNNVTTNADPLLSLFGSVSLTNGALITNAPAGSTLYNVQNASKQNTLLQTTNGDTTLGTNNDWHMDPSGNVSFIGTETGNGSGLTNLTLFIPTNSFGQTLIAGQACLTNMTANVTVTGISGTDATRLWSAYLLATNGQPAAKTVTFPASCKGSGTNAVLGPVWSVPTGVMAEFQVNGYGLLYSNVNCTMH